MSSPLETKSQSVLSSPSPGTQTQPKTPARRLSHHHIALRETERAIRHALRMLKVAEANASKMDATPLWHHTRQRLRIYQGGLVALAGTLMRADVNGTLPD